VSDPAYSEVSDRADSKEAWLKTMVASGGQRNTWSVAVGAVVPRPLRSCVGPDDAHLTAPASVPS